MRTEKRAMSPLLLRTAGGQRRVTHGVLSMPSAAENEKGTSICLFPTGRRPTAVDTRQPYSPIRGECCQWTNGTESGGLAPHPPKRTHRVSTVASHSTGSLSTEWNSPSPNMLRAIHTKLNMEVSL